MNTDITLSQDALRSIQLMQEHPESIYSAFFVIEEYLADFNLRDDDAPKAMDAIRQLIYLKGYMLDIMIK